MVCHATWPSPWAGRGGNGHKKQDKRQASQTFTPTANLGFKFMTAADVEGASPTLQRLLRAFEEYTKEELLELVSGDNPFYAAGQPMFTAVQLLLERKYPCITGVRQLEAAIDSARGRLSTSERKLLDAKSAEEAAQKALLETKTTLEKAEAEDKSATAELDDLFVKRAEFDANGNLRGKDKPAQAAGAVELPDDLAPVLRDGPQR